MLALGVRSGRLKGADRTRSSFIDSDVLIVCRTARTWRPHNPLPLYIHPVIDILHSCIYCFHCTLPIFLQSPVLQWSECSSEQLLGVSTRLSSSVAALLTFVHQHKDFLLTSLYTAEILKQVHRYHSLSPLPSHGRQLPWMRTRKHYNVLLERFQLNYSI
ncbi:hypothetical protein BC629DRAFT_617374 [Irpex lacteus]|nr:hypothetical protein BC629DRAFT_617374 [Irpex lacteus]